VALELVEAVVLQAAVRFEPFIEFDERFDSNSIETTLTVRANSHQSGISEDPEVLRDCGLGEGQPVDKCMNRLLTSAQGIEYLTAARFRKHLDGGRSAHLSRHI
jgi:hypothetical protein